MERNKKDALQLETVNRVTLKQRLKDYLRHPGSLIMMALVMAAAAFTVFILAYIIIYVLYRGVPHLTPELFALEYTSENCSMMPSILITLIMILISLGIAIPFGIGAAIYLVEYAKRGSKLVKVIRMTAETLTGVPSIVYGLFGRLFFGLALGLGYSLLSGCLTLAIMILPTILRSTEEALIAVPDSYREGSFGLGAGKLKTVFVAVLPSAVPGIIAGVILGIGRVVGETAALIYTSGSVTGLPKAGIFGPGRTLAVHLYNLSSEGLHTDQAFATAVVLLVFVILMNLLSSFLAKKVSVKK